VTRRWDGDRESEPVAPRRLRLAASFAGLSAAWIVLVVAGRRLPGLTVTADAPCLRWSGGAATPPMLAVGLVRVAAAAAILWVLVAGVVTLLREAPTRVPGARRHPRLPRLPLGDVLLRLAGLGLTAGLATSTAAAAAPRAAPPPVMRVLGATPAPTMRALGETAPPRSTTRTDDVWVIAPGDHLWHVARTTLWRAAGVPPTDAQVVRYLDRLIDRNAAVFRVPGDADLVYPGQRFTLPPI
jgi:hypothetical protein